MAENLEIEGRFSVRAPMQWSDRRHAGFSSAPEGAQLPRPLVADERFGRARSTSPASAATRTRCSTGPSA